MTNRKIELISNSRNDVTSNSAQTELEHRPRERTLKQKKLHTTQLNNNKKYNNNHMSEIKQHYDNFYFIL